MAEIIKLAELPSGPRPRAKTRRKLATAGKRPKWPAFKAQTLSTPLVAELMQIRETVPPLQGRSCIMEAGVLAYRREAHGRTRVLLIGKMRTKNWGIPKGRVSPHLTFAETAAKEAFEEAGVIGAISPSSVGVFRATKRTVNLQSDRIIEVWVYLLEVTETLGDWPEKGKRTTRWVTCEEAAHKLREPLLTQLCHRLAQS
jgi:8-oxo-dGTP pyrophosphatase MutT (NUDIX family)